MVNMAETIYLVAPAGHPNFGDEYIVSAWLRELSRRRPHTQVILDCHTPGIASILHANVHPHLTVTDTLWQLGLLCEDRKSTRLNSSHVATSYAVFCLK